MINMNKQCLLDKFSSEANRTTLLASIDFKSLINDIEYNDNPIINFLNYKLLGKYDCDKIFGEIFEVKHTDTMNSFWTIFKKYIKICLSNEFELDNGAIKKEYLDKHKNLNSKQIWCTYILDILKTKNINFNQELLDFANLTHTIGNFIEVPEGFNVNRYANTLDYWDITLFCIYKWCKTDLDIWLEILLNNNSKAIQNLKEYLLIYNNIKTSQEHGIWEKFILANDLRFFVDKDFKPIELYENHINNFEKYVMTNQDLNNYFKKERILNPQNEKELTECLNNINRLIIERGKNMAEYEFEKADKENKDSKEVEFNTIIVSNKTNISFPIVADVMNWSNFFELATSDEGIMLNGMCYLDIDLLNKELYQELKETFGNKIVLFRVNPIYVSDEILDWNI